MYELLIVAGTVLLTQITKKYIYPRYGSTGVHVFAFLIALFGVAIYQYSLYNEVFANAMNYALKFLLISVAVYEIILKRIGFKPVSLDTDM